MSEDEVVRTCTACSDRWGEDDVPMRRDGLVPFVCICPLGHMEYV